MIVNCNRDPKDLANYLEKLDSDDDLYRSYFDYKHPKSAPLEETFQKNWGEPGVEQDRGWCGLCRQAARSVAERKRMPNEIRTPVAGESRPPLGPNIRPKECNPPGKFHKFAVPETNGIMHWFW